MSIISGFKKFKRYIKQADGYHLASQWTSASTVEMANGNTLEDEMQNVGKGVELTQAEYDALGDEKLTNDVEYYIKDAGSEGKAEFIDYDNTASALSATNVQGAIDELNSTVEEKANKVDVLDSLEEIVANTEEGRIAGANALNELNSNLSKTGVISGVHLTADEVFTVPEDGYLRLQLSANAGQYAQLLLLKNDNTSSIDVAMMVIATPLDRNATSVLAQVMFVKKGMKLKYTRELATSGTSMATYYKFV